MNIQDNHFLAPFNETTRRRLIEASTTTTYSDGSVIFSENSVSDGVYLVLTGCVELTKESPGDPHAMVLATVPEGECFGEMGVLDNTGRSTGARAAGETRLAKIPAEPLMEVIRGEPGEVGLHIVRRISRYLRETNERFVSELIRKERLHLMGEMASSIIHDFRNPMTSIQLAAQLAGKKARDSETAECCRLVIEQVDRMANMAEEILDYTRGELKLKKQKISIRSFFDRVVFLNKDFMARSGVAFNRAPSDAEIEIDVNRMLRVMQNLLGNAVKAVGKEGGAISLKAAASGGSVEISVSDNGPGISEDIRATAFDPFVTGDKRNGTGLGLAAPAVASERRLGYPVKKILPPNSGSLFACAESGVERVSQGVAQQVESEDDGENGQRDESHFPPYTLPQPQSGVAYHDAP